MIENVNVLIASPLPSPNVASAAAVAAAGATAAAAAAAVARGAGAKGQEEQTQASRKTKRNLFNSQFFIRQMHAYFRQRKIKQKERAYSPAVAKPKVFEAEIDDDDDSNVFKMVNATYQGGGKKKERKPKCKNTRISTKLLKFFQTTFPLQVFPIFSVVTFKNDPCASTSSTTTG